MAQSFLDKRSGKRRLFTWLLILAAWTLITVIFAGQNYVFARARGRSDHFWHEFLTASTEWYVWAALTPLVLFLSRRFRISSRNRASRIPLHLAFSVLLSFLQLVIQVRLNFLINPGYSMGFGKVLFFFATYKFHFNLLTYWVIVLLHHGLYYYEQSRKQELAGARMEAELANAQLQALNMQLHPHFLFNTLHAISTLIPDDPAAAQDMVLKLGDLLRATLSKMEQHEVSLQQELELLDCYLAIEQTRFGDRLRINREIAPETLQCAVPTLIFQPLVENAIRHGIAKHRQADQITISAGTENGHLALEVRNRMGKMQGAARQTRGIGLSNTVARLEQLYGNDHTFTMSNTHAGVSVKITIPILQTGRNIEPRGESNEVQSAHRG